MRVLLWPKVSVGLAILFATVSAGFAADNVGPGSKAPALQIKKWFKGKPVKQFEAGKTYVVEFWATWCGPCIESIPHVTKLAKANKDVTFIGVGIWEEEEGDKIPKFVKSMGDKMDYNVGYSGNKDGMAATWMEAAGQNGIPTAFIVKDQKIAWVGHPMNMDKPLEQIKAGTFDGAAFAKAYEAQANANRERMALEKEFSAILKQFDEGKREEAKTALTAFVAKHPNYAASEERVRYNWLADEDPAAWKTKTDAIIATGKAEEVMKVASFALGRAQKPEGAEKARAAIGMVVKANYLDNFDLAMYAQIVYMKLGDDKEALAATNKMIELFPNSPYKAQAGAKENFLKTKADLEAKIAKKAGSG